MQRRHVTVLLGVLCVVAAAAPPAGAVPPDSTCRISGGGWYDDPSSAQGPVNVAVHLEAGVRQKRANFIVEMEPVTAQFHLDRLLSAACVPAGSEEGGGLLRGSGEGTCGGRPGATIDFTLQDGGSRAADSLSVHVEGPTCSRSFAGPMSGGELTYRSQQ